MKQLLTLKINDEKHELWVSIHKTLLEVLREDLHLTEQNMAVNLENAVLVQF